MKKILSVAAAIALAASIISCGDSGDEFDGKTDTVLTLEAPKVTAKAYPGVNYITWEPIAGAKEFELYRTTDGESKSTKIVAVSGLVTEYADIAAADHVLADGKSYKYTVVAVSSSDPSRAVVVKSSQASATVTAKVPTAGTNVKDFKDAKSYFDKFNEKNLSKNVTVQQIGSRIYAEYPATAGFKYTEGVIENGKFAALGSGAGYALTGSGVLASSGTANYKEDYKAEFGDSTSTTLKSFGKYTVYIRIDSVSSLYEPTYIALGEVETKDIGESVATSGASAAWIDTNKVRISWTPAQLKVTGEEKYTATTNYKVYRTSTIDNTWTDVTGTVVKGEKETTPTTGVITTTVATVYYTDNEVTDNTIGYTYYVVHTDGTLYGAYTSANNETSVNAYAKAQTGAPSVTAAPYNNDTTGYKDTIKIVATKNATDYNQTLAISYVKLAKDAKKANVVTYAADSFTTIALDNWNGNDLSYTVYLKDQTAGTFLIKVVASEAGKKDNVSYRLVTVADPAVSVTNLSVQYVAGATAADSKHILVTDSDINDKTDDIKNYTYKLYKVVVTHTEDYTQIVTVKTDAGTALTLTKSAAGEDLYTKFSVPAGRYAAASSVSFETGSLIENFFYVTKTLVADTTKVGQVTATGL